ncbi:MAG: arginine biosynthesis protein ArgJ, partial [Verrucomicrobia bacterium]|nr:arginine biosynthesis protein ArgJ [Verrucomicrobiota bacterium]
MSRTQLTFASLEAHRTWLAAQAQLPAGFRVGTMRFDFTPREAPKPAKMTLTLIALDQPTKDFAAVFTRNALPGAPIVIGRRRLAESTLGAVIVNNKVSNVCAPNGVEASEKICAETARLLGLGAGQILPCSTGVIGWGLPVDAILGALPNVVGALKGASILPAAEGIVTTDLYPKIRRADLGGGSIVGIAKGAGMIEPNMATMLVYILTDLVVPRNELRAMLTRAVDATFNTISVDSDTSTSDTVALISSARVAGVDHAAFEKALTEVCRDLAEDVVRNGEGVRHVLRVQIKNAVSDELARALGKAIVNAPLFKCAVAGNDPNVGRLVQAIGKHVGHRRADFVGPRRGRRSCSIRESA